MNDAENKLVERIKAGDKTAYEQLRRIIDRLCKDTEEEKLPEFFLAFPIGSEPMLSQSYLNNERFTLTLKSMIDGLPVLQRQTLVLLYCSGMTIPEIAQIMSCSEAIAEARLDNARQYILVETNEFELQNKNMPLSDVLIPLGSIFIGLLKKERLTQDDCMRIWHNISRCLQTHE